MHRNAFTLAVADLELPEGVHFAGRASDKEIGLSMRVVRQYTINNDSIPTRLDVLYGWAPLYQSLLAESQRKLVGEQSPTFETFKGKLSWRIQAQQVPQRFTHPIWPLTKQFVFWALLLV